MLTRKQFALEIVKHFAEDENLDFSTDENQLKKFAGYMCRSSNLAVALLELGVLQDEDDIFYAQSRGGRVYQWHWDYLPGNIPFNTDSLASLFNSWRKYESEL